MSDCPKCGDTATHIAVTFPLLDVGGEVLVTHQCFNCPDDPATGNPPMFDEPARDPLGLLAAVMEIQARAHGLSSTLERGA